MECTISGALGWVIRLSQMTGVYPVRIASIEGNLSVSYSLKRDILGRTFYAFVACFCTIYLIPKLTGSLENNMKTVFVDVVFTLSIIFTAIVATTDVFKGEKYIKMVIGIVNTVQKINVIDIHFNEKVKKVERNRANFLIIYISFLLILLVFDIWLVLPSIMLREHEYTSFVRMVLYCIGYSATVIQSMLFVFVMLMILTSLQAVNNCLSQLLLDFKQSCRTTSKSSMGPKLVRHLATSYTSLCDIMRTQNQDNGAGLLLASILFLVFFGISAFILVMNIRGEKTTTLGVVIDKGSFDITVEIGWCVMHLINILLLLEPCHRMYTEMHVTQLYISRLLHCTSTVKGFSSLQHELELFHRLVITDQPTYMPLQLCTFNRMHVGKMLAYVVSYLVIILQFQVKG